MIYCISLFVAICIAQPKRERKSKKKTDAEEEAKDGQDENLLNFENQQTSMNQLSALNSRNHL